MNQYTKQQFSLTDFFGLSYYEVLFEQENQTSTSEDSIKKDSDNKYLPWILQKIIFYPAERYNVHI